MKFEEVLEEGGKRWSKPHVASLSMRSILETRKSLMEGLLLLDLDVYSMAELVGKFSSVPHFFLCKTSAIP